MSSLDAGQNHQRTSGDKTPDDDPAGDMKPQSPQVSMPHVSHIPQSDSGICLTPQSSVSSPQQAQTPHQADETQDSQNCSGPLPPVPSVGCPANPTQSFHHGSSPTSSPKHADSSTKRLQVGNIPSSHSRSPGSGTPDQFGLSQSSSCGRSSSSQSSDNFNHQTKYLVLQFLQELTSEQHMLQWSHNSLSTTSESDPRFKSHAQRLRRQWQDSRAMSSPTPPRPKSRARPLAKTQGSRSSPNLKDANFFKDMPPARTTRVRRPPAPKAVKPRAGKRSPMLPRQTSSPRRAAQADLLRSVSQSTENSEHGTYHSDADDELDASFDSSHQGSVTSHHLRNRLTRFHNNRLPTLHSESESAAGSVVGVAEECTADAVDDGTASSILSLDMINLEQQPVSPDTRYARVSEYLDHMCSVSSVAHPLPSPTSADGHRPLSESTSEPVFEGGDASTSDVMDTTLRQTAEVGEDEVDSPPFDLKSHPDQAALESGRLQVEPFDQDGAVSGGFEPNQSNDHPDDDDDDDLGACGGVDAGDVDVGGGGWQGQRPDRSKLQLDLSDLQEPAAPLIDAVHVLQQEIEEEMSSFGSEFEEGWCWCYCYSVRPTKTKMLV